jgi:hypothetical protein
MSTTIEPRASAELERLQSDRDQAHAKVREARQKVEAHDAETEAMRAALTHRGHTHPEELEPGDKRPRKGTEAAKQAAAIRKRRAEPNPHQPEYDATLAEFHAADTLCQEFRRRHVADLLAELDPEFAEIEAEWRDVLEREVRLNERYQGLVSTARDIVIATPGLTGQHVGWDPRPNEKAREARRGLDSELAKPGLTPSAEAKLADYE